MRQRGPMCTMQGQGTTMFCQICQTLIQGCYASSTSTAPQTLNAVAAGVCQSNDQPNPIASTYPNNATGVLNGTIAVVPIPLDLARQLIPSQYRILEHAYRHLLPSFPKDMYPAVVQAVHDHDIQVSGFKVPDFSVSLCLYPQNQDL